MNTNKRFTIEKSTILNGAKFINDKNNEFIFTTTEETQSLKTYEKALNKLNEENEKLHQEVRRLKIDFNDACGIVHDLRESKLDLEDENEELKKENEKLKDFNTHYEQWFRNEEIKEIIIGDKKVVI